AHDHVERRPELVGDGGHELGLEAARLPQIRHQAGVLERDRGLMRQSLRQGRLPRRGLTVRRPEDGEDADHAPTPLHGDAELRVAAEPWDPGAAQPGPVAADLVEPAVTSGVPDRLRPVAVETVPALN